MKQKLLTTKADLTRSIRGLLLAGLLSTGLCFVVSCEGGDSGETPLPKDVTDFSASPGDGKVSLTWTAPTDDIDGLMLTYEPDAPSAAIRINAKTTSYEVVNLTNDTEYTFAIVTFKGDKESKGVKVTATPKGSFFENFTEACNPGPAPDGWVTFIENKKEGDGRGWACSDRREADAPSMEINGFLLPASADNALKGWLISPKLTTSATSTLTFKYSSKYDDGDVKSLEVRVSTDYSGSGDPTSATWIPLDAGISYDGNSDELVESSEVGLTAGEGYIAFFYQSSGTAARRIGIDDVKVTP